MAREQVLLMRTLTRLKLHAKRDLQLNIDVRSMTTDKAYADFILKIVQGRTKDPVMFKMVGELRDLMMLFEEPVISLPPTELQSSVPPERERREQ